MPRETDRPSVWAKVKTYVGDYIDKGTAANIADAERRAARHDTNDQRVAEHNARQALHRIDLPFTVTDRLAGMTHTALDPQLTRTFLDNLGRTLTTPRIVAAGIDPEDTSRPLTLGLTVEETNAVNDVFFPPLGKNEATVQLPPSLISPDGIAATVAQVPLPGTGTLRDQFVFTDSQVLTVQDTVARTLAVLEQRGNPPLGASITFFSEGISHKAQVAARKAALSGRGRELRRGHAHAVWKQPMITFTLPRPMQ